MCKDCFCCSRTFRKASRSDNTCLKITKDRLLGPSQRQKLFQMPADYLQRKTKAPSKDGKIVISDRCVNCVANLSTVFQRLQQIPQQSAGSFCGCRQRPSPRLSSKVPRSPTMKTAGMSCAFNESSDEHQAISRLSAQLQKATVPRLVLPLKINAAVVRPANSRSSEISRTCGKTYNVSSSSLESIRAASADPGLIQEIIGLRKKKRDLEQRMVTLQQNKEQLIHRLEILMMIVKKPKEECRVRSCSECADYAAKNTTRKDWENECLRCQKFSDALSVDSTDKISTTSTDIQTLKGNLMNATDCLTSAMMSLVRELNLGADCEKENSQKSSNQVSSRKGLIEVYKENERDLDKSMQFKEPLYSCCKYSEDYGQDDFPPLTI